MTGRGGRGGVGGRGYGPVVFVVAAVALGGWTVLAFTHSLPWMEQVAAVLGGYGTLVGGIVAVRRRLGPQPERPLKDVADELAGNLLSQWRAEAAARSLDVPHILPLAWRRVQARSDVVVVDARASRAPVPATSGGAGGVVVSTPPQLTASPAAGGQGGGVLREGQLSDVADRLAGDYRDIRSGRLVVLGEPGAGKTVLAMLLTIGLLQRRATGEPVPVLLSVSSWDPVTLPLDAWLIEALARSQFHDRTDLAARLWEQGLLLPILDGLDEIPEASRRMAVAGVHDALGSHRPVVVTCRSAEYRDVLRAGSPQLHRAPVIEIEPVRVADLITYFGAVTWPPQTDWGPVFAHLHRHPDSPLSEALGTALMVTLTRLTYERLGGNPAELLDAVRFSSRHAIENHVLGRMIPAAYAEDRLPSGTPTSEPGTWTAAQAERWLTFLARHLHEHRERDLAWWRLGDQLVSRWVAPVVTLLLAALVMVIAVLGHRLTAVLLGIRRSDPALRSTEWSISAGLGLAFWVLAMLLWYGVDTRPPGRLSPRARGAWGWWRRGCAAGAAIAGFPLVLTLVVVALVMSAAVQGWTFSNQVAYVRVVAVVLAWDALIGVAVGVCAWLAAPPPASDRADPQRSMRQDRWASLVGAVAAGLVVGLLWIPVTVALLAAAEAAMGWPGTPVSLDGLLREFGAGGEWGGHPDILVDLLLGPGLVLTLLILLVRAWPRFLVLRLHQFVLRQLPLRLMTFLADARARGVLRESSGHYQFAHIRLQEHLALGPPRTWAELQADGERTRRHHRRLSAVAVAVTALTVGLVVFIAPHDDAGYVIGAPERNAGGVRAFAVDPAGSRLVASYDDGSLWVWPQGLAPAAAQRPQRLPVSCGGVGAFPYLAIGSAYIVAGCDDGLVLMRQEPDGSGWAVTRRTTSYDQGVRFLAATDTTVASLAVVGHHSATATINVRRWLEPARTATDRPVLRSHSRADIFPSGDVGDPSPLALSADGRYLAAQLPSIDDRVHAERHDSQLYVWDLKDIWAKGRATAPARIVTDAQVTALTFRDGNKRLAWCTANGEFSSLITWSPPSTPVVPEEKETRHISLPMQCLNQGDHRWVASADGEVITLRDVRHGTVQVLHGHTDSVTGMAFAVNPQTKQPELVSGAYDGTIRFWPLPQ